MEEIFFKFFGRPEIFLNGTLVDFHRTRSTALLSYLYVNNRSFTREEFIELFWPGQESGHSKAGLRTILSDCRTKLGNSVLKSEGHLVSIDRKNIRSDYYEFLGRTGSENPSQLKEAERLYQADFMNGFSIEGCPDFEDWLFETKQQTKAVYFNLLEKLLLHEESIELLKKILKEDPLREDYHRKLIIRYADAGNLEAAERQYRILENYLKKDDGSAPDMQTKLLMKKLKNPHKLPSSSNSSVGPAASKRKFKITTAAAVSVAVIAALGLFSGPQVSQPAAVAVLPFNFLCNDENAAVFAESFTIDLITNLAVEEDILVTPHKSVAGYKETLLTVKEIADELDVDYIIDGSAMSFSDGLHFSLQLINPKKNECIWADSYECEIDESLSTQSEVISYMKKQILKEIRSVR